MYCDENKNLEHGAVLLSVTNNAKTLREEEPDHAKQVTIDGISQKNKNVCEETVQPHIQKSFYGPNLLSLDKCEKDDYRV